jgi:hypothetical protein
MELDQVTGESDSNHHELHLGQSSARKQPPIRYLPAPTCIDAAGFTKKVDGLWRTIHFCESSQSRWYTKRTWTRRRTCRVYRRRLLVGNIIQQYWSTRKANLATVIRKPCELRRHSLPNTSVLEIWTLPLQIIVLHSTWPLHPMHFAARLVYPFPSRVPSQAS